MLPVWKTGVLTFYRNNKTTVYWLKNTAKSIFKSLTSIPPILVSLHSNTCNIEVLVVTLPPALIFWTTVYSPASKALISKLILYQKYTTYIEFEDNLENYMPGTVVQTEGEFLELIKNQDFKIVKSKAELNKYKDNKSCERIMKELGI